MLPKGMDVGQAEILQWLFPRRSAREGSMGNIKRKSVCILARVTRLLKDSQM